MPQSQKQLEPTHHYAPEVVATDDQVATLAPRDPSHAHQTQNFERGNTTAIPTVLEGTEVLSVLGSSAAKIVQVIEALAGSQSIRTLIDSRPSLTLAILLSVTVLCLTSIYAIYSIIYAHMGLFLIGFLATVLSCSIGIYLFIIKQSHVQIRREEVRIKSQEVQQEWLRTIGSKLQPLSSAAWPQSGYERHAMLPIEYARFEELIE
jgi:hypothetical protein